MAGDGTTYEIDLRAAGATNVTGAADSVDRMSASLEKATASATAAAEAVKAGEAAYKAAESSADKAAKAVEKVGLMADAQRGKLAKAMEAGDTAGVARAESALAKLSTRQAEAATKAAAATVAMNAEAEALDRMKASAAGAAASQASVSKALDAAKSKAAGAAKALAAAGKPINAGEAAGALGKLGGPLGAMGQKAFDAADAFKKMGSSLGSAGPYVAVAVGLAAIVAGIAAIAAAAAVGIGGITIWAVKLADTTGAIPKMVDRATKGFNKIFSGLKIGPLLAALEKVADLFDEGSASAKAVKVVFESLFQPVVDGVTAFVPKFISAFIQFQIWVLKALIAIKPFGSTILEVGKWIGIVAIVIGGALAVAIGAVVVGVGAMAVGFAALVAIAAGLAAGFIWLTLKAQELTTAVGSGIADAFSSVVDFLSGLSLTSIGDSLIQGLIDGIMNAGPGVLTAITGIASGAINAAKKALGIASPSKIFAEIGMNTAAGMEAGVDDGAGAVGGAMESMVSPPDVATGGAGAASTGVGGVNNYFTVSVQGGDAKANVDAFREFFEGLGAQAGTAVAGA